MLSLALTAALVPAPLVAHHGWSSYHEDKPLTVDGTITASTYGNPHGTAKLESEGKTWDVVLAPVARMEARGLTPAMIGPHQRVTIVGYPRRDGTAEMRLERIIAGGKTIELR